MANRVLWLPKAAILAALVAPSTGCSRSPSSSAGIDAKALVGTWTEVRSGGPETSSRVPNTETAALGVNLRQMTFKEDGTYTAILVTPDGKPSGSKASHGTWKIQRRAILFQSDENTFDAAIKSLLSPMSA